MYIKVICVKKVFMLMAVVLVTSLFIGCSSEPTGQASKVKLELEKEAVEKTTEVDKVSLDSEEISIGMIGQNLDDFEEKFFELSDSEEAISPFKRNVERYVFEEELEGPETINAINLDDKEGTIYNQAWFDHQSSFYEGAVVIDIPNNPDGVFNLVEDIRVHSTCYDSNSNPRLCKTIYLRGEFTFEGNGHALRSDDGRALTIVKVEDDVRIKGVTTRKASHGFYLTDNALAERCLAVSPYHTGFTLT